MKIGKSAFPRPKFFTDKKGRKRRVSVRPKKVVKNELSGQVPPSDHLKKMIQTHKLEAGLDRGLPTLKFTKEDTEEFIG